MTRAITVTLAIVLIAAGAIYLHDPPWVGDLTYGFRAWDRDAHGERFRWTRGRGSFFVPSDATAITLKFRSHKPFPPNPIKVHVSVDDRWLATITLPDPLQPDPDHWVLATLPLPRQPVSRRFRRIDVRVRHWMESYYLGVHMGEVVVERPAPTF